ncbi:MAG: TetR/AcrR family transcriptional regulator [Candidatus Omnitrophica bacterium]|nr:TetR/AcrR family transcriptional regulator [Candidatus Omnitrophota bacterium]
MNVNSLIEDKFIMEKQHQSLNRRDRDRLLRQADILRAAEHVFALKGYHEATMQDIAKEAEYGTGTVYLYFKDKDALYFSLFEQKFKDLLLMLKEETAKASDAKSKLEIFVLEKLSFFERNQDFFRIFISESSKFQAMKASKYSKSSVITQHRELVNELIKTGQGQRIIRSDFHFTQIADIFTSMFMAVVFDWFRDGSKNVKQMSAFILDMFFNGAGK